MKIKANKRAGITLLEILVVLGIIGSVTAIAIPSSVRAKSVSRKNLCISNLRLLDGAVQVWAMETSQTADAAVTADDVMPYLDTVTICPAGGTTISNSYTLTTVSQQATCRIAPSVHVLQ
jgi:type II secretory pathway pseudopilin PulG